MGWMREFFGSLQGAPHVRYSLLHYSPLPFLPLQKNMQNAGCFIPNAGRLIQDRPVWGKSVVFGRWRMWKMGTSLSLSLSLFRPVYPDEACLKGLSALYSTGSKCLDFCLVHCLKGLFIFSIASVQKCTILNMTFFTIILYLLLRANICIYFILFCYVLSFIKGSLHNTHCINRFQKPATWEFELQVSRKKNSRLSE